MARVKAQTLIQDLWRALDENPSEEIIVQIEHGTRFYNLRFIPLRYAPDGTPVLTLRTTDQEDT